MNSNNINEINKLFNLGLKNIRKNISLYSEAITKQIKEFIEKNLNAIVPFLNYINGIYRELPEKLKIIIKNLAYRGWYISIEMDLPELTLLSEFITNKKYDKLDNYMCNIIESKLDQIEKEIIQKYPNRRKIIQSAFNAHKKGEYELSVPVFLAQADGICNELLEMSLYKKYTPKKKEDPNQKMRLLTANEIEKYVSNSIIMSALVEPLRNISGLNVSTEYKNQYPIILNRHEIIHGLDLNYGNKKNSLKTITLLHYFISVVYAAVKVNTKNKLTTKKNGII
ncbi:MAG: hypothetical protein KAW92_06910 [Candidatus Cloacimonetes bacterium]|nr:hypothetical protein [Candidatus Cloacimonadota bacterium]